MKEKRAEKNHLFVIVKIEDAYFCVNSKYISDIIELPKFDKMSDIPNYFSGMFTHRNQVIYMLDVRSLFGIRTLIEEYKEFTLMIDARKQDHIRWIEELNRSLTENIPFTLATNPHQCALGRWYDNFTCKNNVVKFHLKKMEGPHKSLHKVAEEAVQYNRDCDNCTREEYLQKILKQAKEVYMPTILELLDGTKDLFKNTIYHEKVLILNGENPYGLVVDEVIALENIKNIESPQALYWCFDHTFVKGFYTSDKIKDLILEINIPQIMTLSPEETLKKKN